MVPWQCVRRQRRPARLLRLHALALASQVLEQGLLRVVAGAQRVAVPRPLPDSSVYALTCSSSALYRKGILVRVSSRRLRASSVLILMREYGG